MVVILEKTSNYQRLLEINNSKTSKKKKKCCSEGMIKVHVYSYISRFLLIV